MSKTHFEKIAERFAAKLPNKRLLAATLNGFSHTLYYDSGTNESPIESFSFSEYAPEMDWGFGKEILYGIGHIQYQNNPIQYVWIAPDER